jgi:hypothetical protein
MALIIQEEKAMKTLYVSVMLLSASAFSLTIHAKDEMPVLEGPYLGQTPPGLTPEVFAPGIISTDSWEYGVFFAPGMQKLYWIREAKTGSESKQEFVVFEQKNNKWHERVISERRGTPTLSTDVFWPKL